ncbi:hypothetical protein CPter291_0335 [Collimonas pratensis]|uniref:Uncharacterized protein n=1 Tax=Collimonas pratensis TaxID=279113 RepID=A0ABM5Z1I0_9BURK|nr:hypothetical protein CPter291_0335 [Collimonas pratensis]
MLRKRRCQQLREGFGSNIIGRKRIADAAAQTRPQPAMMGDKDGLDIISVN